MLIFFLFIFSYKDFWIISLIILLVVYILGKLKHLIRGLPLDWSKSYLSNRSQNVSINGSISLRILPVSYGVPQRSKLGLLLFLVFINNLPNSSDIFKFLLVADASTVSLLFKKAESSSTHLIINQNIRYINNWLNSNKIQIIILKTKYMLYSCRSVAEFDSTSIDTGQIILRSITCMKLFRYFYRWAFELYPT